MKRRKIDRWKWDLSNERLPAGLVKFKNSATPQELEKMCELMFPAAYKAFRASLEHARRQRRGF
jgi:hypothetical protein